MTSASFISDELSGARSCSSGQFDAGRRHATYYPKWGDRARDSNCSGLSDSVALLHWLTAIVVLATIPVGVIMTTEGLSRPLQNSLFIFHKNVGVVILLLVAARLLVRAMTTTAPLPETIPQWQRMAAAASHGALYLLLIVMAVSGYARVIAGGFPIESLNALGVPPLVPRSDPLAETAQWIHSTARFVLVAFILLHVGAALQHGIIKRDGVFSRMWPLKARYR